jgi:diguanylate cyclase (GGDEF)-like protein/putative nucleotidyltransferase with HDIG domain
MDSGSGGRARVSGLSGWLEPGFQVSLPGMTGTLSANFLFVLYSLVEFSFGETMLLAVFLTASQCLVKMGRRFRYEQLLFNTGVSAVATAAAYGVSHLAALRQPGLESTVRLFAGAIALFLIHNLATAYMIAQADGKPFLQIWRECLTWGLPSYVLGVTAAGLGVAAGRNAGWQTAILVIPVLYLIFRSYRQYIAQIEDEKKHTVDMASLHLRTIEALALAIEAKGSNSHEHLHRMQVYSTGLAEAMHLPQDEVSAIRAAALLHDIGKLAVPEHIISKRGELTTEELDRLKIHPVIGAEILGRVRFPYPVEPIVRSHHEHWDGTGYPEGLRGTAIPIGARILSVVDAFDNLAGSLAAGENLETALRRVEEQKGRNFDPAIVDLLSLHYRRLEERTQATAPAPALQTEVARSLAAASSAEPQAGLLLEKPRREVSSSDFLQSIAAARQEVNTLFELAQDLGNSLSLDETLRVLTGRLERIVPHDCIVLYLLQGRALQVRHAGGSARPAWAGQPMAAGEGLAGWVVENRKPILNGNPSVEPGYDPQDRCVMRSAVSVPLEGINGIMGAMTMYSMEPDAFTKDHLRILLAISSKIALSVENALKFLQAENSATTDYLTGLPNARSLYLHLDTELARCSRANHPCAVLVCDLDGFKQVNDRFGHLEGNRVLRVVSEGMRQVCREYDYVARMGGDEFVVVLPGMQSSDVEATCARLDKVAVEAGIQVTGERVLAMSIGCADERMYANKRKNKENRPPRPAPDSRHQPSLWKTGGSPSTAPL